MPISELEVGDTVLAYDETTGTTGDYDITHTWEHQDEAVAYVTIDGEVIETTPWHHFLTTDGWHRADELEPGEEIVSLDGTPGLVEGVVVEVRTQTMYDLTVDEAHTFFVGDGEWLVHNTCEWFSGKPPKPGSGVYKYIDQKQNLPYFGEGDLSNRLYNHIRRGELPNYDAAQWMKIPFEWSNSEFDRKFVLHATERVMMYNASGGDINKLANALWRLNDTAKVEKLKKFYEVLPEGWLSEFIPVDDGFFKILPQKDRR